MRKDWEIVKLEDVCQTITDGVHNSPKYSNNGIPMLDSKHINHNFLIDDSKATKYISHTTDKELSKRCKPQGGDVLVSSRGTIGKIAIVKEKQNFNIMGNIILIRPSNKLNSKFIAYSLLSYIKDLTELSRGVAQKGLYLKQIRSFQIPIPPLSEQKQIVALLDRAFAAIDQAKANIEKNIENARELFQSKLDEVFAKKGEDWELERFGNICKFVRGPFGGSLKKSIFVEKGFAVYEQQHAINNQFENIRYFITEEKFNEMKRFELEPNDLIMSCSGTMGRVAIVPENVKQGIINQALLKLTPDPVLDVNFLKLWMQSNHFLNEIDKHSTGAAIKNIASVKVLKEIKAPLPSVSNQKYIVNTINKINKKTSEIEQLYQKRLERIEELKKSILEKAFNGELTVFNRNFQEVFDAPEILDEDLKDYNEGNKA